MPPSQLFMPLEHASNTSLFSHELTNLLQSSPIPKPCSLTAAAPCSSQESSYFPRLHEPSSRACQLLQTRCFDKREENKLQMVSHAHAWSSHLCPARHPGAAGGKGVCRHLFEPVKLSQRTAVLHAEAASSGDGWWVIGRLRWYSKGPLAMPQLWITDRQLKIDLLMLISKNK